MIASKFVRSVVATTALGAGVLWSATPSAAEVHKSASGSAADGSVWLDGRRAVQDGYTDWVIDYENPLDEPGSVSISDEIEGAQTYQVGSLKVPPGWEGEVDQPEATAAKLTANGGAVPPRGRGTTSKLVEPVLTAFSQANSGGDGYRPILWTNPDDPTDRRIYTIFHHTGTTISPTSGRPNGNELWCAGLETGALCPGFPREFTTGDPIFDAGFRQGTSGRPLEIFDGTRMYFPYGDRDTYGAACFDVATAATCGYTPLSNSQTPELGYVVAAAYPDGTTAAVALQPHLLGWAKAGERTFGLALDTTRPTGGLVDLGSGVTAAEYEHSVRLMCFTTGVISGVQPCPGIHGQVLSNGFLPPPPNGNWGEFIGGQSLVVEGRVYFTVRYPTESFLICVDGITGLPCAGGFESPVPLDGSPTALLPLPSSDGVCIAMRVSNFNDSIQCFHPDASANTPPIVGVVDSDAFAGLIIAGTATFVPTLNRLYVPEKPGDPDIWNEGATLCWDFSTESVCEGFSSPWDEATTGDRRDYAYTYDEATGCLWGGGDAGLVWSFDPFSGASPCVRSRSATGVITPSDSYCDGQTGHVTGWGAARLDNAQNVSDIRLTVRDANGEVVPGWNARQVSAVEAAQGVDLSSIDYGAYPELEVEVNIGFSDTSWWNEAEYPTASVTFEGDPVQVCFQTRVLDRCETVELSNTVAATALGAHSGAKVTETASVAMPVDRRPHACPDLVIDKSVDAASFNPGSTLNYTLRVSNREKPDPAQGTDAVNVVVRDVLPAGVEYVADRVVTADGRAPAYDAKARTLTWTVPGPIEPNAAIDLTYPVVVTDATADALINTAVITSVGETPKPSPPAPDPSLPCADVVAYEGVSGPCDSASLEQRMANLSVVKAAATKTVLAGANARWRIEVRNEGPDTADDVVITDSVPDGFALTALNPSIGQCERVSGTCRLGALGVGESATVEVVGRVAKDFSGGDLTNTALVSSPTPDREASNNVGTSVIEVDQPPVEFSIVKSSEHKAVRTTDEIAYTISVRNGGERVAAPEVFEVPGAGLTLLRMSSPNGRCTIATRSCELAELKPGESATVRVLAKVDGDYGGSAVENSASVRSCCSGLAGGEWSTSLSIPIGADTVVSGAAQAPVGQVLARTGQNVARLLLLGFILVGAGDTLRLRRKAPGRAGQ